MLLRTRLVLLVVGTLQIISIVFGVIQWRREVRFDERYSSSLLLGQQVAWDKIVARQSLALSAVASQITADNDLMMAIKDGNRAAYATILDSYVKKYSDRAYRVELFGSGKRLLYTSSMEMSQTSSLDARSLDRLIRGGNPISGVNQLDALHFQIIAAQSIENERTNIGVIVIGQPVREALAELKQNFGADAYMVNLHGRVNEATGPKTWLIEKLESNLRTASVVRGRREEKTFLGVSQPVKNSEGRTIGAVITVRDTTEESDSDRLFTIICAVIGIGFAALAALGLFLYVRSALKPLNRAVQVLDALAKGDTSARLPDENEEATDEAGHIAQGISVLRDELVNFSMLRDERTRQNRRQEQLIRQQLVGLAETLDEEHRNAIIADLETALQADREGQGNQLATLAAFLGQMSSLIKAQYQHLLQLIEEVKAAADTKARYAGLQQELDIARNMQQSILPREFPPRPEVDLKATMIPAKEVGGDFYDFFWLDDTHLAIVVADVSGKGVAPAFFMAITRTLLQATARFVHEPSACIERLNDLLAAENEQMMFVTTFYGVLDVTSGAFKFVNAGHNPPIWWKADQSLQTLPSTNGIALAVMDGMPFNECTVHLEPGDTLILFTDGVTEAIDVDEVLFADERLLNVVRGLPATIPVTEVPERIVQAVRDFAGEAPQADDITCLSLRYFGVKKPVEGE